jgi:hypothetical protein
MHLGRSHFVIIAFAAATIFGCGTPKSSTDQLAEPGATVEGVIEARLLKGLFPHLQAERRKGPGEVIFEAYFNEVNFTQLSQPANELSQFCRTKNGTFQQLAPGQVSAALLARPAISAREAFNIHWEAYRRLGLSDGLAAVSAAFDTQYYSMAIQQRYPPEIRATLAGAEKAGAFGRFDCRIDGRPLWVANIEPIKFNPQQEPTNLLRSPGITLYIKGVTLQRK